MCSVSALIMARRKYEALSSVVTFLLAYNLTEEKDRFVLEWRLGKHATYKIPWRQNTFLIFYVNLSTNIISSCFNSILRLTANYDITISVV